MSESFEEIANSDDISFDKGNSISIKESKKYIQFLDKLHSKFPSYKDLAFFVYQLLTQKRGLEKSLSNAIQNIGRLELDKSWDEENRRWEAMRNDDGMMKGL